MPPTPTAASETEIMARIVQEDRDDFSPDAARAILGLRFHPDDVDRMNQLALKARDGRLTHAEQAEMESYRNVGYLLGALWSKVRLSLKEGSSPR